MTSCCLCANVVNTILYRDARLHLYATDLIYYTHVHWFFSPECQHIFGITDGVYISVPQKGEYMDDKTLASPIQWHNTE
jgi:hypothetical protein